MNTLALEVIDLPIEIIDVSELNPRRFYDSEGADELKHSLDERGQIYPVIVRPKGERFDLFIGSRRLLAAQARKQQTISAIIRHNLTDQDVLEMALAENLQRADLTPFEEAWAIVKLIEDHKLGIQEVARRIGKGEGFVRRRIKLLSMPKEVQQHLSERNLSVNHIDHLTSLDQPEDQIAFAQKVVDHRLSEADLIILIQEELEKGQGSRRNVPHEMSGKKVSLRIKGVTLLLNRLSEQIKSLEGEARDEVVESLKSLRDTLDELFRQLRIEE